MEPEAVLDCSSDVSVTAIMVREVMVAASVDVVLMVAAARITTTVASMMVATGMVAAVWLWKLWLQQYFFNAIRVAA